jgi:hypothetical protein
MGKWSKRARVVIDRIVAENPNATPDELFTLVNRAYPFGERAHHPYTIWRAEMAALRLRLVADDSPEARPCGACGAKAGRPCVEFQGEGHGRNHPPMIGFHEARLQPSSGPLFGDVTTTEVP